MDDSPVIDDAQTRIKVDGYSQLIGHEQLSQVTLVSAAVALDPKSDN